jgi:hypothetical protein
VNDLPHHSFPHWLAPTTSAHPSPHVFVCTRAAGTPFLRTWAWRRCIRFGGLDESAHPRMVLW